MFERNRNVRDPRAVAALLNEAEKEVQRLSHPDPYRGASPFSVRRKGGRTGMRDHRLIWASLVTRSFLVPGGHKMVRRQKARGSGARGCVGRRCILTCLLYLHRERNVPVRHPVITAQPRRSPDPPLLPHSPRCSPRRRRRPRWTRFETTRC